MLGRRGHHRARNDAVEAKGGQRIATKSGARMKPTLILVIAVGLVCQNLTGTEYPKSTDGPVDTLKKASLFCIGGFGYVGTISPGEKALRELMKRTDAKQALIKLLDEATPEGQMYALGGARNDGAG